MMKPMHDRLGRPHRGGMSLVEVLVSVMVMGTVATLYGSMTRLATAQNEMARETELATLALLRQMERIRSMNPRDAATTPFNEPDLSTGRCPPYRYTDTANDLDPPVQTNALLTSTNSRLIPAGHPWMLDLGDLVAQGYAINVRCNRVRDCSAASELPPPGSGEFEPATCFEDRLIKYCVRIDRTRDGIRSNLITAEFFQEVQ